MSARLALPVGVAIFLAMNGSASARGLFDPIPMEMALPHPEASPGYVHLSAQPTEVDAEALAAEVARTWGKLLEGHRPLIRRVDYGVHGVRYRVLLKTHTMGDAWRICMNIKGAGGDCFVAGL